MEMKTGGFEIGHDTEVTQGTEGFFVQVRGLQRGKGRTNQVRSDGTAQLERRSRKQLSRGICFRASGRSFGSDHEHLRRLPASVKTGGIVRYR
jgi:hypothetical protein